MLFAHRSSLASLAGVLVLLSSCRAAPLTSQDSARPAGAGAGEASDGSAANDAGRSSDELTDAGQSSALFPCVSSTGCTSLDDAGALVVVPCAACPADQLCEAFANEIYFMPGPAFCREVPPGCTEDNICACAPYFTTEDIAGAGTGYSADPGDGGSPADFVCYTCVETLPYGDAGPPTVYCTYAIP